MVRPDNLSRPMYPECEKRPETRTLALAADYLRCMRQATEMRERKLWFFFKTWRQARLDKKATAVRARAWKAWGELYLRFRPVISFALQRGGVFGKVARPADALNKVIYALEQQVEIDTGNECFAALLWQALEVVVYPNVAAIEGLRVKLHARAVLDECLDGWAVVSIELLCYLRGELMANGPTAHMALSDLELDQLDKACECLGAYLQVLGPELDRMTANVLTYASLMNGNAGQTVRAWVR